MHESSAFFCFAFDRKRHSKPEVIGEQHTAPHQFNMRRQCLCQEGRINKMKRLSKNGVWDFQAGRARHWHCPSRAAVRSGHREGLVYAARGNRSLKIQTGAKIELVKSSQALWPLLGIMLSQLRSSEESSQRPHQRESEHSEQRGGCEPGVGKSRRENTSREDRRACPRSMAGKRRSLCDAGRRN